MEAFQSLDSAESKNYQCWCTPPKGPDSFILTYKISKRNRLGSPRPPSKSTPPLWEILDPPLARHFVHQPQWCCWRSTLLRVPILPLQLTFENGCTLSFGKSVSAAEARLPLSPLPQAKHVPGVCGTMSPLRDHK